LGIFDTILPPSPTLDSPESAPKRTREDALRVLARVEQEVKRRRWKKDPVAWCEERLGETLWSLQKRTMWAVRDHRKTVVKSCHAVSKSHTASRITAWWLDIHKPGEAFVVTSASTASQVRAVLWREIGRAHSLGDLNGRCNQTEWLMEVNGKEELVAMGRKPDEFDATAFQGIHAPKVLVIFDEACGINGPLWDAADSLIANADSKFLAIGNPDDPQTEFYDICKPGSGWHVLSISAFETPNLTGESMPKIVLDQLISKIYVEEKRRKWAPTWEWNTEGTRVEPPTAVATGKIARHESAHPFWFSKVLGEFPIQSDASGLIPLAWIHAAQQRTLKGDGKNELGVDVGAGGDESTCAHNRGGVVRIIWSNRNPDTMATCGEIIASLRKTSATVAKIDSIGIGRGVADRGKELAAPIVAVNVGEMPMQRRRNKQKTRLEEPDPEDFINLKAEACWGVREMFERGEVDIDPEDEDLATELANIRYSRTSSGKLKIESKDDYKRRTKLLSPNRFDALVLALMPIPEEEKDSTCAW
jgi:hypothetical protein